MNAETQTTAPDAAPSETRAKLARKSAPKKSELLPSAKSHEKRRSWVSQVKGESRRLGAHLAPLPRQRNNKVVVRPDKDSSSSPISAVFDSQRALRVQVSVLIHVTRVHLPSRPSQEKKGPAKQ